MHCAVQASSHCSITRSPIMVKHINKLYLHELTDTGWVGHCSDNAQYTNVNRNKFGWGEWNLQHKRRFTVMGQTMFIVYTTLNFLLFLANC